MVILLRHAILIVFACRPCLQELQQFDKRILSNQMPNIAEVVVSHECFALKKKRISQHISGIWKKIRVFLRLRDLIAWSTKLQLHKSNILPLLTYCDIVLHFCKSSDKKKMEGIQERALRAAFKLKSEIYSELNNRSMSTKSV